MSSLPSAPAAPTSATPPPAAGAPASVASKIAEAFKTSAPAAPTEIKPVNPNPPKALEIKSQPSAPIVKPDVVPSLIPKKAATPAPVAEADPFEKFSLPDTAPEEQKSQFTQLKTTAREQAKKLAEYEAKLKQPTLPAPEVEKLRTEHKAALDRLAVLDLKSHPDFKRQFDEPRTRALAEVAEVLAYSGKTADLQTLLGKDRKAFSAEVSELTKDMNPMDATTVQTALRQAYQLSQDEKGALAKSSELSQQLQQRAEAQARQAFEEVSANLGPMGEFLVTIDPAENATPEERAELETYNAAVTGFKSSVEKSVFGPTNEKSMALLAHKAGVMDFLLQHGIPRMDKEYKALYASHQALAAELAAIKGQKGSGPIAGDPGKGGDAKLTTEQMVAQAFRR